MNKRNFFLYLIFLTVLVLVLTFIPIKKITSDNYVINEQKFSLYDNVSISNSYNYNHENLDSINFKFYKGKTKFETKDNAFNIKGLKILDCDKINNEKLIIIEYIIKNKSYKKNIKLSNLKNGNNIVNEILNLKDIKYEDININITTKNITADDNIYIYLNNQRYYSFSSNINSKNSDSEISIVQYNHIPSIFLFTTISVILCIIFLIKTKKTKIYDNFKFSYLFIFNFLISIVSGISFLQFCINYSLYEIINIKYFIILFVSLILLLKLAFEVAKKYKNELEKVFAILAILIGIMYTFVVVTNGGPDETCHYYQAEELANFDFGKHTYHKINKNFILCNGEKGNYECLKNNVFGDKIENIYSLNTAAVYNKILYIPAAIGIKVGQIFNMKLYVGHYLARIFDLLLIVFAGYFSIKLLPKGKLILFTFLLNPKFIAQSTIISADVVTNAVTILFMSLCLSEGKFDKKKKLLAITLLLLFVIIKKPYQLLALLLVLRINKNKMNAFNVWLSKNKKIIKKVCTFVATIILGYIIVANLRYPIYNTRTYNSMIREPIDFIAVSYNTIVDIGSDLFLKTFGGSISWHSINVIYVFAYVILLLMSTIIDKVKLLKKQMILYLVISLSMMGIIFAGFLAIYNDAIEITIRGMQGRYFFQSIILLLLVISSIFDKFKIRIEGKNNDYTIFYTMGLLIINFLILIQQASYMM